MQNLPISKMNCADSTERPLKLPEPVFHCVDIFHHQPDNIDVPSKSLRMKNFLAVFNAEEKSSS